MEPHYGNCCTDRHVHATDGIGTYLHFDAVNKYLE